MFGEPGIFGNATASLENSLRSISSAKEDEDLYAEDVATLESMIKKVLLEVHKDLADTLLDQGRRIEQAVYDQQHLVMDACQQHQGHACLALGEPVGACPVLSSAPNDYCCVSNPTEPPNPLPPLTEELELESVSVTGIECGVAVSSDHKPHGIEVHYGDHSNKDKEAELQPARMSLVHEHHASLFGSEAAVAPCADRFRRQTSAHGTADVGHRRGLAAVVFSPWFDYTVGIVIMLNAIFICLQADYSARHPGEEHPPAFGFIETGFFIVFFVEVLLRISVLRCRFCRGADWTWNVFDTVVVLFAGIEEVMKLVARGNNALSSMTVLRAMRIIKLTRVVRIIRLVKMFRELRIMMMSILSTIRTLFWSVVCLLMIMCMFGVYIANTIADYQAEAGRDPDMTMYFGTMPDVMISLFQATTGGLDWRELSNLLLRASTLGFVVFLGYICMMVYAIMNILTGICVNNANKAAEDDFDNSVHEELSKHNSVVATLRKILRGSRGEELGVCDTITWPELEQHLIDPKVRGYFKRIELEPWHLQSFFELLKVSGEDEEPSIAIDQFIRGCMRLRCNIKNIDLMASRHEMEEVLVRHISEVKHVVNQVLSYCSDHGEAVDVK